MLRPASGVVTGAAAAPPDAGAAAVTPGGEHGVKAPGSSKTAGEEGAAVTSDVCALGRGESGRRREEKATRLPSVFDLLLVEGGWGPPPPG